MNTYFEITTGGSPPVRAGGVELDSLYLSINLLRQWPEEVGEPYVYDVQFCVSGFVGRTEYTWIDWRPLSLNQVVGVRLCRIADDSDLSPALTTEGKEPVPPVQWISPVCLKVTVNSGEPVVAGGEQLTILSCKLDATEENQKLDARLTLGGGRTDNGDPLWIVDRALSVDDELLVTITGDEKPTAPEFYL
jgi:hypothetical protein